jgi:hypothetical protein
MDHRNLIASDVEPKWLKEAAEVSAEAGDYFSVRDSRQGCVEQAFV